MAPGMDRNFKCIALDICTLNCDFNETKHDKSKLLSLSITFSLVRPACDIAISGLGWIAVEPIGGSDTHRETDSEQAGELHLAVHVPKPVEVFLRPPMPVGKAGEEWYQYQELTEKEEELRPKWFY